jgi:putative DNA primase/helicase
MQPHEGNGAVRRIVAEAEEVVPDDNAEVTRLAALSPIECDRQLAESAKWLGCKIRTLRRQVEGARNRGVSKNAGQGRALNLEKPEPWPDPVDGADLLNGLTVAIRRYVVIGGAEATAVALWVMAVHAFDGFMVFPRLFVTAPEKGCGKSTLLDVLSRLVPKPLGASSITAASLFRVIEKARPTLLLDEADAYVRNNEDLRAVLDAGHRRDGAVIRTVGDDHEPRQFSAFAPMVLAAIGRLPGTIEDRSIKVGLRRRRPDEHLEPLRVDRARDLEDLARKAARWAADHSATLGAADPKMPAGVINRAADNWRPLLAVADAAGADWAARARDVAAAVLSGDSEDADSIRVLLLSDLRDYFADGGLDIAFTAEVLRVLGTKDERPWPEFNKGKPISARQLAALLKPFGIRPKEIRRGTEVDRGYRREWFDDAFARYVPAPSVTASQPSDSADFHEPQSVTRRGGVTDGNGPNPRNSAGCNAVTDKPGILEAERVSLSVPDREDAGQSKFVYQPLPSGWRERLLRKGHEERE